MSAFSMTMRVNQLSYGSAIEAARKAARPAAQAGAQIFHDAVRAAAPRSEKAHYFHGSSFKKTGQKYLFQPGNLQRAIYQAYSKDNSNDDGLAEYHVGWNHAKAPYGFMVEFGTVNTRATPFLRPAYYANQERAFDAMEARFWQDVDATL